MPEQQLGQTWRIAYVRTTQIVQRAAEIVNASFCVNQLQPADVIAFNTIYWNMDEKERDYVHGGLHVPTSMPQGCCHA